MIQNTDVDDSRSNGSRIYVGCGGFSWSLVLWSSIHIVGNFWNPEDCFNTIQMLNGCCEATSDRAARFNYVIIITFKKLNATLFSLL
jgi:hypothetical protein